MITYVVEVEVTFEPKLWVLKWPKVERARIKLAMWLVRLGLRVSGSEALLLLPQQVKRNTDDVEEEHE